MARKKSVDTDVVNMSELEKKVIRDHCGKTFESIRKILDTLNKDFAGMSRAISELSQTYDINIDRKNIEIDLDNLSVRVDIKFKVNQEKIMKREKTKAIKDFVDKYKK